MPNTLDNSGRILIVDDEPAIRDSLDKWFTCEGYFARTAASDPDLQ